MNPKVSLIIPVYNVELYLEKCLDSAVNQSFSDIEIITVNDGSTDKSLEILEQYQSKDKRIKIIKQENQGLSVARNVGIKAASGEFLAFLDSDDFLDIDMIKIMYEKLQKDNLDIVICGFNQVDEQGDITHQTYMKEEVFQKEYVFKRMLAAYMTSMACNKLFKKSLFIDHDLFYPVGIVHEDLAVTYKSFYQSNRIGSVPYPLYNWFRRQGSITKSVTSKHIDNIFYVLEDTKIFLNDNDIFEKYFISFLRRYFHFSVGLISRIDHANIDINEKAVLTAKVVQKIDDDNLLTDENMKLLFKEDQELTNRCLKVYRKYIDTNKDINQLENELKNKYNTKGHKIYMIVLQIINKLFPIGSQRREAVKRFVKREDKKEENIEETIFTNKDKQKLVSFHNKYKGKRCFIIGNGPSLNKCDLRLLKNEYSFAVNGIFYKTDEMGYKPNFYMVEDGHVVDDNLERINNFDCENKFFPSIYKEKITNRKNTYFFNCDLSFYQSANPKPNFSTDFSKVAYAGQSVTMMQLQLAYYLGFTEVYFIGMDFSYDVPESTDIQGSTYKSNEDDPNHFHPDYFGKGKKWHDPKLDRVLMNYEMCKKAFESDGRKIYNATVGGKLELFERVEYTSLFK